MNETTKRIERYNRFQSVESAIEKARRPKSARVLGTAKRKVYVDRVQYLLIRGVITEQRQGRCYKYSILLTLNDFIWDSLLIGQQSNGKLWL